MVCAKKHLVFVMGLIIGLHAGSARAQTPTFSLEAAAINGKPIANGPVSAITAFPGDVIKAEVYLRDWSPDGEILTGYQAALLPTSFSSGKRGYIEPVDYEKKQANGEENNEHSYVDDDNPRYAHRGLKTLALADTRSEGYRWMSVVLVGKAPKCKQDGTKFYAATVDFAVSPNAEGTFDLEVDSNPDASGIREDNAAPLLPVNYEGLAVRIVPDPEKILDGLNGDKVSALAETDANGDGRGDYRDMLFSIASINVGLNGA